MQPFVRKIYYNNKPLILTTNAAAYLKDVPTAEGYFLLEGAFARNFRLAIQHMDKAGTLGAVIEDVSQKSLEEEMYKLYQPIEAGGGVVQNEDGDVLMIYRRGKWDLPKGKRDEGEEIDYCALREVSEETGLQQLTLGEKICDTYHIYAQNKQTLLKRTTWFSMFGTHKEKLHPQKEENILEAKWVSEKNLPLVVFKSYDAIKEVLTQAGFKW